MEGVLTPEAAEEEGAPATLLRVRGLSKTFPGLRALDGVSLELRSGEILALVGQNGSGKSTFVKTLAGLYAPDPGSIVEVRGPSGQMLTGRAAHQELHFIHQDLGLVPQLTTIENFDLGQPMARPWLAPFSHRREVREVSALVRSFGGEFSVTVPVATLTPAERTIVAIARALHGWERPDHVLVLDEPTAALHGDEARKLAEAVRRVARAGAGVIFISHRLDEVLGLADRIVALRDGAVVADEPAASVDHAALARMIVGRQLEETSRVRRHVGSEEALTVEALRGESVVELSFSARTGEIVGISGLLGSGREHVCGLLFGAAPRTGGQVRGADGTAIAPSPAAAIANGVGYVPADRRTHGAVMSMSVRENLTLADLGAVRAPWGAIDGKRELRETQSWVDRVELRPRSTSRPLSTFSGGNQQKVVLAKWLRTHPRVLLLDEPTQGVDIGAKAAIYRLLLDAAEAGCTVVVSSSDTKELVTLCDRVLVLRDGRLASDLHGESLNEEALVASSIPDTTDRTPGRSTHAL